MLWVALIGPAPSAEAIEGSERTRAVNHTAVEWARALHSESQRRACRWTVDELDGTCEGVPEIVAGCAAPADGPPPPTPARTAPEQIGAIEFLGERAKVRLRPERRGEPDRAWLVVRHVQGRWRIVLARFKSSRFRHSYRVEGRIFREFFLGFCVRGDYRE